MNSAFKNKILNSFADINKAIYALAKSDAEHYGLTVVQLKAIYQISAQPNSGLADLAEQLKLTNSTVSGVVDRLVQHEYVERRTPPEDRRAITLNLAPKGEQILEQMLNHDSLLVERLREINQLPETDLQQLLELHQKILTILSK